MSPADELIDLRARHDELRRRFEAHELLDEQRHSEIRQDVSVVKERVGETQAAVIALNVSVSSVAQKVNALEGRLSWRVALVVGGIQGLALVAQQLGWVNQAALAVGLGR